uniref:Uncharacterized protein n=1 Tax=Glossina palpalis gambiensis TaxID=67801 RepID=A0A1B0BNP7_9MUSC
MKKLIKYDNDNDNHVQRSKEKKINHHHQLNDFCKVLHQGANELNTAEDEPLPTLHLDDSQQEVQAYSFVRSPITMQPDSQVPVHRRSKDHIFGALV